MPIIDIAGKRAERQAQMLMMMQQFRNRSTIYGGETELERVEKEIEAERLKQEAADRAERQAGASIKASEALTEQRQKKADLDQWKAGEQSTLDWQEDARKQRELTEGTLPLRKAQTGEAQARTGLINTQRDVAQQDLAAKKAWLSNQQNSALEKHTNDQWNMGVQNILSGNPSALTKDNADNLEKAGRLKFGPGFTLPRTEDGSLDPKAIPNIAATVTDEKGQPTTKFLKGMHDAAKPYTNFEANVQAWQDATTRGRPEEAKWYADKLWSDV